MIKIIIKLLMVVRFSSSSIIVCISRNQSILVLSSSLEKRDPQFVLNSIDCVLFQREKKLGEINLVLILDHGSQLEIKHKI